MRKSRPSLGRPFPFRALRARVTRLARGAPPSVRAFEARGCGRYTPPGAVVSSRPTSPRGSAIRGPARAALLKLPRASWDTDRPNWRICPVADDFRPPNHRPVVLRTLPLTTRIEIPILSSSIGIGWESAARKTDRFRAEPVTIYFFFSCEMDPVIPDNCTGVRISSAEDTCTEWRATMSSKSSERISYLYHEQVFDGCTTACQDVHFRFRC